jgi:subtilisin family serine protease
MSVGKLAYGAASPYALLSVKWVDKKTDLAGSAANALDPSVAAMEYAIDHGARIINYSAGGSVFSQAELDQLKRAERLGILVVAAAGNDSSEIKRLEPSAGFRDGAAQRKAAGYPKAQGTRKKAWGYHYYPAEHGLTNLISVGAVTSGGALMSHSNWGMAVDVAAPGENIWSSVPGGGYDYMTGTSQATAFVTGVAALILSQKPDLEAREIKQIIEKSVRLNPRLSAVIRTGGTVDAGAALSAISEAQAPKAQAAGQGGSAPRAPSAVKSGLSH